MSSPGELLVWVGFTFALRVFYRKDVWSTLVAGVRADSGLLFQFLHPIAKLVA
jgi:hypothetical protein